MYGIKSDELLKDKKEKLLFMILVLKTFCDVVTILKRFLYKYKIMFSVDIGALLF